jgi:hypothetical protein
MFENIFGIQTNHLVVLWEAQDTNFTLKSLGRAQVWAIEKHITQCLNPMVTTRDKLIKRSLATVFGLGYCN